MFKVMRVEPKPISWWRAQRSKIDIAPPYQRRGRIWSTADKAFLIDSILNGYDMPKLYVADFTLGESPLNKKKLSFAIIDGKQRLEAILDFYDGTITLNDDFQYSENAHLPLAGLSYKDLRSRYPEVADTFDTFPLPTTHVFTDDERAINELFIRLNRSKPLTGAEIRNAMTGPVPKLVREIVKHEFFKEYIRFNVTRGQDHNAATKILLFEYKKDVGDTKRKSLDAFVQEAKAEAARTELAARRVIDLLDSMTNIFLPRDSLLGSAGALPVYYWLVSKLTSKERPQVREFLVKFEKERKTYKIQGTRSPGHGRVDREIVDYEMHNRNTNDEKSHNGRLSILILRFKRYARERNKSAS